MWTAVRNILDAVASLKESDTPNMERQSSVRLKRAEDVSTVAPSPTHLLLSLTVLGRQVGGKSLQALFAEEEALEMATQDEGVPGMTMTQVYQLFAEKVGGFDPRS